MADKARLVVLISGTGRNLQSIISATQTGNLNADIAAVISNRPDADGLRRAKEAGIPTEILSHLDYDSREAFDSKLAQLIDQYRPDLVALAGFMRILTPGFVKRYQGRMFNIHPSLLPKYQGLNTHQRALDAGDKEHGASIHYVTPELDGGPVVLQGRIEITTGDTSNELADRVMREIELHIYPRALAWAADGRLRLTHEGVEFDGKLLDAPMQWHPRSKDDSA